MMRILHILYNSIPPQCGDAFRTGGERMPSPQLAKGLRKNIVSRGAPNDKVKAAACRNVVAERSWVASVARY